MKSVAVLFVCLLSAFCMTAANVVLIGNNVTLSFADIEANFGELFASISILNFRNFRVLASFLVAGILIGRLDFWDDSGCAYTDMSYLIPGIKQLKRV